MQKTIKIEGMTCGHCESSVKEELEALSNVDSADVSADNGQAVVEMNDDIDSAKLKEAVKEAGYEFIELA